MTETDAAAPRRPAAARRKVDAPIRKALFYSALYGAYGVRRLFGRAYVVVSPAPPTRMYALFKVARAAGVELVGEGNADDAARRYGGPPVATIRHADLTWDGPVRPDMINGACTDISKTRVDEIFESVFGYATRLDPRTHKGRAVVKSEINYGGGGRFVDLPIPVDEIEEACIYQKLVDNEVSPGVVKEFRVAIIGREIADVVEATRRIDRRLSGRGSGGGLSTREVAAEEAFTDSERADVLEFCKRLGLEFGELDILPDIQEGRIYVLDANKTPTFVTERAAFRLNRLTMTFRRAASFRRFLASR
ncbi:MAG: hypothetical protein ACFB00_06945 [Parvularculaceae bacterium]